jgi:DNA-binding transcriptional MerR regulator
MNAEPAWTLDQLMREVERVLINQGPAQLNRLVREIPSERTVRFYTTEGLIDEPAGMRGHLALYGRRHLLQLVAIKRLQAEGASLAQIREQQPRRLSTRALERLARGRAPVARSVGRPEEAVFIQEPGREYEPGQAKATTSASRTGEVLQGVEVRDGVTVLVRASRALTDDDAEAIRVATTTVIDVLTARELLGPLRPR